MKIVLMGKTGSGKGTYAQMLEEELKILKISTGDLLREEKKKRTKLGLEIKKYVDKGLLVPDKIIIKLFRKRLSRCKGGFILDGFPRNMSQVESLEQITKIDRVIYITSSDKIVIERLAGRRQCKKCGRVYHIKNILPKVKGKCDICGGKLYIRTDETKEVIKKRLATYKKETKPVIDYYRKKGLLVKINGEGAAKEVFEDIRKLFK